MTDLCVQIWKHTDRKLSKTVQTMTTFRNPLADTLGTRRRPTLVRGPQFEKCCVTGLWGEPSGIHHLYGICLPILALPMGLSQQQQKQQTDKIYQLPTQQHINQQYLASYDE